MRSCLVTQKQLRDVVARLDSFEKEVVSLKAFRAAVETVSPEVAAAAETIAKQRWEQHQVAREPDTSSTLLENPLTPDEFGELYQFYAEKPHRPVRLDNIMNINNITDLLNHAKMFHREFAVRVAKRAATLNNAPLGLGRMSAIEELRKMYEWSFSDLRSVETPTDRESALALDRVVRRVYLRHQSGRPLMLDGLRQLTHREGITRRELRNNIELYKDYEPLQDTFEHFVSARAKLRFLLVNYMELSHRLLDLPASEPPPNLFGHNESTFAGTICKETSMVKLVDYARREAEEKFPDIERYDEEFPKVNVRVVGDPDLTFIGFPQNTVQIITAMIEAAIRSNLRQSDDNGTRPTPVNVVIAQRPGCSEIGVRVSDTAGGIPFHELPMSLAYLYNCDIDDPHLIELPYVAVLAKTFGGHLQVSSIDGYGTDRVLYTPAGKSLLKMAL
jgi:pyruvate dehydrogenase kinase 2/3/4